MCSVGVVRRDEGENVHLPLPLLSIVWLDGQSSCKKRSGGLKTGQSLGEDMTDGQSLPSLLP